MKSELADIASKWQRWFPDCPPLSQRMLTAFTHRWCTIYGQPGGERLPEIAEERRMVLERHAVVSTDVLGLGSRSAVIMAVPRDPAEWTQCPWMARLGATVIDGWIEEWSDRSVAGKEDAARVKLAVAFCDWRPDRFEELILDVATDRNWTEVVFASLESGRVYSPYDGGADLFVEDKATAHALWDKYLAMGWTPPELYSGKPMPGKQLPWHSPWEP
ncbi:MAG: hypothetical protein AB7O88_00945 [Reyranellaceae bacterium]